MNSLSLSTLLLEGHTYSWVGIDVPPEIGDFILDWGRLNIAEDVLYFGEDGDGGFEENSHVTLKYGLLEPVPSECLRKIVATMQPFVLTLTHISLFRQEDHDVVKINVDSPGLRRLNARVSAGRPHADKWPSYRPHVTVGYVKKGAAEQFDGTNIFQVEDAVSPSFVAYSVSFRGKDGEQSELSFNRVKEAKELDPYCEVPFGADASRLGRVLTRRRRRAKNIVDSLLESDDERIKANLMAVPAFSYRYDPIKKQAKLFWYGQLLYLYRGFDLVRIKYIVDRANELNKQLPFNPKYHTEKSTTGFTFFDWFYDSLALEESLEEPSKPDEDADESQPDETALKAEIMHSLLPGPVTLSVVLNPPHEFYHRTLKDSRRGPLRARPNGKVRLWKRRPEYFELPMKYGMYEYFYITPANADEWSTEPPR